MYKEIYELLCLGKYKQKLRQLENHHIIPKYLGGTNDFNNIVKLDVNQHKIAHWLLWKIYKNPQDKLVWFMRSGRYEEGIEIRKKLQREYFDRSNAEKAKIAIEVFENTNKLPDITAFEVLKEKKNNPEKKYTINNSLIKNETNRKKRVYMFMKDGEYIQFFDNVYSASESLKYNSPGNLHSAAVGNRNYAAGFRWSFNRIPNAIVNKERTYKKTGKQKNPSNHVNKTYVQVLQYNMEGELLHTWNNRKEIEDILGISNQMINHVLNGRAGKNGVYRGFLWKKGKTINTIYYKDKNIELKIKNNKY